MMDVKSAYQWLHGDRLEYSGCRAAAEAMQAELDRLRAALALALPALEFGVDAMRAEAEQYHAAMHGYRPHTHAALDAHVRQAEGALEAVRAALTPNAALCGPSQE